jgi:hypothetical protein
LKTETVFIDKGHDNNISQDLHYHDLAFHRLYKTHVNHDN